LVIGTPGNMRVYLARGVTDVRKGFDGLAARVQTSLSLARTVERYSSFAVRRVELCHRVFKRRFMPSATKSNKGK
jgi:hypothetical protein